MAEYEPPEPKRDFKGNAPKSRLKSRIKGVKQCTLYMTN